MSQNLPEDILHKVTLTKIINNATLASGWARFSFYFFVWFYLHASCYHKLRKGKTTSFSFLLWIGPFFKGRHKHQPDLGAPRWEDSKLGAAACSFQDVLSRALGSVLEITGERSQQRAEWDSRDLLQTELLPGISPSKEQHWEGPGACGAVWLQPEEAGTPQRTKMSCPSIPATRAVTPRLAALFPKSMESLYIIRVPRIWFYWLFSLGS